MDHGCVNQARTADCGFAVRDDIKFAASSSVARGRRALARAIERRVTHSEQPPRPRRKHAEKRRLQAAETRLAAVRGALLRGWTSSRRGYTSQVCSVQRSCRAGVQRRADASPRARSGPSRISQLLLLSPGLVSFGLGCWQLQRREWKMEQLEERKKQLAAEALPLRALAEGDVEWDKGGSGRRQVSIG